MQQTHLLLQSIGLGHEIDRNISEYWILWTHHSIPMIYVAVSRHKEDASAPRFLSEQEETANNGTYWIILLLFVYCCCEHAHTPNWIVYKMSNFISAIKTTLKINASVALFPSSMWGAYTTRLRLRVSLWAPHSINWYSLWHFAPKHRVCSSSLNQKLQ